MSYISQVIILQCGPPSCTLSKKAFLSPSLEGKEKLQFGQEENISGNSIERRVY